MLRRPLIGAGLHAQIMTTTTDIHSSAARPGQPTFPSQRPVPTRRSEPEPEPAPAAAPVEPDPPEPAPATRPEPNVPLPLPRYQTSFLRWVAGIDAVAGAWLMLAAADRVPCSTRLCEVATLNGQEQTAGLTALLVAAVLTGAALFTGGLRRARPVTARLLLGVAGIGSVAATGVVLAGAVVVSLVGFVPVLLVSGLAGAVRGRLTE